MGHTALDGPSLNICGGPSHQCKQWSVTLRISTNSGQQIWNENSPPGSKLLFRVYMRCRTPTNGAWRTRPCILHATTPPQKGRASLKVVRMGVTLQETT